MRREKLMTAVVMVMERSRNEKVCKIECHRMLHWIV